ncbi:TetR/AcrR family transcriptional regulator [Actinoallomurus rhizosphaericola]|uniref:TetR/AcrR family transcriptional regulator n=1 Tax=Actinoallomurus rhizosphaericola TaxID=2952536 RepID=UPI00209327C5|nr:TetR/AcrR family transcriptional regulator [Actinoallomurus rhizosphaericola]MCO5995653.1 TetR/AcrR family transcriptional regulator [Actinoallomurus rhizosphaericola]
MQDAATGHRERKKAETREALRAAAIRLFLEHGPSAVTVNDICDAAGVSRRTFFNYFESKEAALFAWDQRLTDEFAARLAARPSHEAPLTALRRAMDDTLPSFAAQTGWDARKMLFSACPELRTKVLHAVFRLETRLVDTLTDRIGCPADSLYPRLLAAATGSAFRAAFTGWTPETGIEGLQALIDQAFDHLAAGLPVPAS